MEEKPFAYKSNQIIESLPPCAIDLTYLKKLYGFLEEINKEAAEIEVNILQQQPNQTIEDFNKLKEYCRNLFKISIQILGSKGEYIFSESASIFDETKLPDNINKIIFDNSSKYSFELKRDPANKIKLEFDFQKQRIFDLQTAPSLATPNTSSIFVLGNNELWVSGTYRKIMESLKERTNQRGWLHKNNVYDIFIWFLIIPITFRTIYKLSSFQIFKGSISNVLLVAIYLYIFIFILNIFRMTFNYSRWVFPKQELTTSLQRKESKHRYILGTIFLAILASIIYDILPIIARMFH